MVAMGVHWWTAATRATEAEIQHVMGPLAAPERPGGFGHPHRRLHESGTSVYCGSDVATQPVVINAPGEVCEGWWQQLAGWSDDLGAWCTRVDVAADVDPPELARQRLRAMHRAFRRGSCDTTMRRDSCELIVNDREGEGWTLYLGGKSSQLRIRVYDRRGPLRIEPQWRPPRQVGEVLPSILLKRGAAHVWRHCASAVRFELPWYRQLLEGETTMPAADPQVAAIFDDAMKQLAQQYGTTFWAMIELGMDLRDLSVPPVQLRGSQASKLLGWATAASGRGLDGARLRQEVLKRCPRLK